MTETETTAESQRVVDDALLRDISMERRRARFAAESARAKVASAEMDAQNAERRVAELDRVHQYMTEHVGMTLEQVETEAQVELERLGASLPGLEAAVRSAEQDARDWEGYVRIKRRDLDELRARRDAERAEKGLCLSCGQPVAAQDS